MMVAAVCVLMLGCDNSTTVEPVSRAYIEQAEETQEAPKTYAERWEDAKEENKETGKTIRDMIVSAGRSLKGIVEDIKAPEETTEDTQ